VLKETTVDLLLESERNYIIDFNSTDDENGYNLYEAQRRPVGWKHSIETKQKLREIALKNGAGKHKRIKKIIECNNIIEGNNIMNEVKSVLIDEEVHKTMKKFSAKSGMKIKFIAEESIKEFIEKWRKENGNSDLQV
jgi:hypothetical protein